jgi:hypothetical protein
VHAIALVCVIIWTRVTPPSARVKSASSLFFSSKSFFHCAAKSTTFCSATWVLSALSAEDSMRPAVFRSTHASSASWA